MKANDNPTWRTRLFGPAYEQDERIKSATDKAGNYSFCLLMSVLYVSMAVGILTKKPDLYMIPGLIFSCGCMIYLFFMVRTSALSADFGKKATTKKYYPFALGVAVFAVLDFGLHYYYLDDGTNPNLLSLFTQSLFKALLWIVLFILLLKMLNSYSNRRVEKEINKE